MAIEPLRAPTDQNPLPMPLADGANPLRLVHELVPGVAAMSAGVVAAETPVREPVIA